MKLKKALITLIVLILLNTTLALGAGIGSDKLTYDLEFTPNGVTYFNATPPQNRTNVAFTTYTWSVKTCNAYGCSPSASDTFNVYNTAPQKTASVKISANATG